MKCIECGFICRVEQVAPEFICPACGSKMFDNLASGSRPKQPTTQPVNPIAHPVIIVGVRMSFLDWVSLLFTVSLASIPAVLLAAVLVVIVLSFVSFLQR